MAVKRDKPKKEDKKRLQEIVSSSPNEIKKSKDMLEREATTLRCNRRLWAEFKFWCSMNHTSRSDVIEEFLIEKMGKNKDDYR